MMDYNLEVLPRKIVGVKVDNVLFTQIFVSLSTDLENNHTTDYSKTPKTGTNFGKHTLMTK